MPRKSERRASGAPDRRQPGSSPQDTRHDESSSASRSGSGRNRSGTIRRNEDSNEGAQPRRDSERRKVDPRDDTKDYGYYDQDTGRSKERDRSGYQPYMPTTGEQTHLPDQSPGQVPQEYSLPYRPRPTTRTDSYGEASEYYGDEGQSVQHQPGVRPGTPIVVGAEPHLLAASATAVPAQDTGNGSAAEFYGASATSALTTTSAAYDPRPPLYPPSKSGAQRPIPHSSQSEPGPSYAVPLALGAAGLVAAEMLHHEEKTEEHANAARPQSFSGRPRPHRPTTVGSSSNPATAQSHRPQHHHHQSPRRRGTLGKFVDWWNDHEGVEKMEMYTQYIGVCRDCFDPHTSPVDAPRRHHYRRRVNAEHRHRVDKDSRYSSSSSDSESSRRRHSTRRRHSPRLERRSSDRVSNTSYGVVEIDRRSNETKSFEEDSRDETSTHAEYDRESLHSTADAMQGRRPPRDEIEFRHATKTQAEYSPDRKAQGFFSSFFSPSSNTRRRERPHRDEDIEVALEADGYRRSQHSKRKRGQSSYTPTTVNATQALLGLGAASAALAAVGGQGSRPTPHAHSSRSHHHTVEGHRRSRSEDSWESASVSDESSSIHSALAFGEYEVEPPRKRRASQDSFSSQSSNTGKWDWRRDERRSSRNTQHDEGRPEVLFDREKYRESWNDETDFQESRQRPLQTLDPRPMSPGSEIAFHNHGRDIRLHQPQPVSPPKAFSRFEIAEHGSRPRIYHAQSAPTPLAYTSKGSDASERWQENIDISENFVSEASSSRSANETDQAQRESSQLNKKTRDAVTTVAASALAGAAIGALAKSGQRKERKASVRFAGIDSEEEDVTTAQHHSHSERRESISSAPTISETTWREVSNESTYGIPLKSSAVLANNEQNYSSPTFKDFSANDHRDYHEPILDDDVDDRDFFKRSSSTSDVHRNSSAENHRETNSHGYEEPILTDKQEMEADAYVARLEKRYSPDSFSVSQAEFFRPQLEQTLSEKANALDRRLDESADDTVQYYDDSNDRPPFMRQSSVPTLRIIAATPPPELLKQRKQGAGSSRLQYSESQDSPEPDVILGAEAESKEESDTFINRSDAPSREPRNPPSTTVEDFREEDNLKEVESEEVSISGGETSGEMRTKDEFETNVTSDEYANETFDEEIERKTPGGFIEDEQETTEDLGRSEATTSDFVSSATEPTEDWEPSPKVDIETYPCVKSPQSSYAALSRPPPHFVRHQFPGIEESVFPFVSATGTMFEDLPDLIQRPRTQQSTPSDIIAVPYSPPLATPQEPTISPSSHSFGLTSPRDDPRRLSANLAFQEHSDAIPELTPLPESRPNSPYSDQVESPLASPKHSEPTPTRRHSHTSTPSTTAIPLRFLRHAQSPSWSRSLPFDMASATPSSPIATPQSPNTPARPKARPSSGEFKTWHEFRPLYLVERNAKSHDSDELLDTLPSLPSSTTGSILGSRTSSIRDGGDGEEDFVSAHASPAGSILADEPGDGYLEQANYFDRFDDTLDEDVKYLDSQQATPKATTLDVMGGDDEIPDLSIADDTIVHHEVDVPESDTVSGPTQIDDEDDLPFETPMEQAATTDALHAREVAPIASTFVGRKVAQSGEELAPQRPSILGRGLVTATAAVAAIAADVAKRAIGTRPHDLDSSDERGLDAPDIESPVPDTHEQEGEELWPVKALSKKDKKKAKQKGRKLIEEPVIAPVLEDSTVDDTEISTASEVLPALPSFESRDFEAEDAGPADGPADWSFTSTSKKDKRKGKKSKSLPSTTPVAALAEKDSALPEPALPVASTAPTDEIEDAVQPTMSSFEVPDTLEPETPEPESFWEGTFTSKKDNKKAKKQAKTQSKLPVAAPAETEDSVVEPEPPAASAELPESQIEAAVQPKPSSPSAFNIPEPESAEPESFWEGTFTSKKDKKDKKKAKKQAKLGMQARLPQSARIVDEAQVPEITESEEVSARDIGVEDQLNAETIPLPATEDTDLGIASSPRVLDMLEAETAGPESFWEDTFTSKKDKKKAKKQAKQATKDRLSQFTEIDNTAQVAVNTKIEEDRAMDEPSPETIPLPAVDDGDLTTTTPFEVSLDADSPRDEPEYGSHRNKLDASGVGAKSSSLQDVTLPPSESDKVRSLAEPVPQDVPLPTSDPDEATSLAEAVPQDVPLPSSEPDEATSLEGPAPQDVPLPISDSDETLSLARPVMLAEEQHDFRNNPRSPTSGELELDDQRPDVEFPYAHERAKDRPSRSQQEELAPELIALPGVDASEATALTSYPVEQDQSTGVQADFELLTRAPEDIALPESDDSGLQDVRENTKREDELLAASSNNEARLQTASSSREAQETALKVSNIANDVALPEIDATEVQALADEESPLHFAENVALPDIDSTEVRALGEETTVLHVAKLVALPEINDNEVQALKEETFLSNIAEHVALPDIDASEVQALAGEIPGDLHASAEPALPQQDKAAESDQLTTSNNDSYTTQVLSSELPLSDTANRTSPPSRNAVLEDTTMPNLDTKDTQIFADDNTPPEEPAEDEWYLPSAKVKKGKKGKKGRKTFEEEEVEPSPVPEEPVLPRATAQDKDATTGADASTTRDSEAAADKSTTKDTEVLVDDEWALPTYPKKGKKGRKQRQMLELDLAAPVVDEAVPEPVAPYEPAQTDMLKPEALSTASVDTIDDSIHAALDEPLAALHSDDRGIPTIASQPIEAAEDDWAFPVTTKKGKKGKKARKSILMTEDEVAAAEPPMTERFSIHDRNVYDEATPQVVEVGDTVTSTVTESPKMDAESSTHHPPTSPIPDVDDKGEGAPSSSFDDDASRPKEDQQGVAPTTNEADADPGDDDEWAFPITVKKGKKGKKGKKAWEDTETTAQSQLPPDASASQTTTTPRTSVQPSDPAEPVNLVETPSLTEAPIDIQNDKFELPTSTYNAAEPEEDEWAFPISKKSKKGKKGKKAWEDTEAISQSQLPSDASVAREATATADGVAPSDTSEPVMLEQPSSTMEAPTAMQKESLEVLTPTANEVAPAEDDWDFPITTKKGKKGKKGRKAAQIDEKPPKQDQAPAAAEQAQNPVAERDDTEALLPSVQDAEAIQHAARSEIDYKSGGRQQESFDRTQSASFDRTAETSKLDPVDDDRIIPATEMKGDDATEPALTEKEIAEVAHLPAVLDPADVPIPQDDDVAARPALLDVDSKLQDGPDVPISQSDEIVATAPYVDDESRLQDVAERGELGDASETKTVEGDSPKESRSAVPTPTAGLVEADPAEDEWAFPITVKKGKKVKKDKLNAASIAAESSTAKEEEPDESKSAVPTPIAGLVEADPAVDEWAFPVTVKSKKGKKNKLSTANVDKALVNLDPSTSVSADTASDSLIRPQTVEDEEDNGDEQTVSSTVKREPGEESQSAFPTPVTGIVTADPAEDEWAFPVTTKKVKRGKKNKFNAASEAPLDPEIPVSLPADTTSEVLTQSQGAKDEEGDQWLAPAKKGKKGKKSKGRGTSFTWTPEVEENDEPTPMPEVEVKDKPTPMPEVEGTEQPTPTPEVERKDEPKATPNQDDTSLEDFVMPGAFLSGSPSATVTTALRDLEVSQKYDNWTGTSAATYLEDGHITSSKQADVPDHIGANTEDDKAMRTEDEAILTDAPRDHNTITQQPSPEEIALPPSPSSAVRDDSIYETPHHIDAERDDVSGQDTTTSPSQYLDEARRLGEDSEHKNLSYILETDLKQTREDEGTRSLANQLLQTLDPDSLQTVVDKEAHAVDSVKTPDWDPNYITQWATIADTVTTSDPHQAVPQDQAEALSKTLSTRDEPEDWSGQLAWEQEPAKIESTAKEGVWKESPAATPVMPDQELETYSSNIGQNMHAPSGFSRDVIEEEPEPWAFTVKSKKSKKSKKSQAVAKPAETRHDTRDDEEAALIAAEAGELRPDTALSSAHNPGGLLEIEAAESQEMPAPADLAQNVIDEEPDPWAFTVKSKKGKKGRKTQAASNLAVTSQDTRTEEESTLVAMEAGELRLDTTASNAYDGGDFLDPQASAPIHEPNVGDDSTLQIAGERDRQVVQHEHSAGDVPAVGEFATMVESPAPIEDSIEHSTTHEQGLQTQAQPQEDLEYDEWAQSFRSKDKKKKKDKDREVDILPLGQDEQHPQPKPDLEDPKTFPTPSIETSADAPPDDDFWGSSFTSQKKKKGKRGKDKEVDVLPPVQDNQYPLPAPNPEDPESLPVSFAETPAETAPDDDFWGSSSKSQKKKKGKKGKMLEDVIANDGRENSDIVDPGRDGTADDVAPPVPDEQYPQATSPPQDLEPLPVSTAATPAETAVTAPDDDFWGSSFKVQKRSKKGKKGKVLDDVIANDSHAKSDVVEAGLETISKDTKTSAASYLSIPTVKPDNTQALEEVQQTTVPEDDFGFYSQSKKKKGKKNRGRSSDFASLRSEPATPVADERELSYGSPAPPEERTIRTSWADEMEALDAAEQGSAGTMNPEHQHQDTRSQDFPSRCDTDAGDVLGMAADVTVTSDAEALETVEAGFYGLSEQTDTRRAASPGVDMREEHSIDRPGASAIADAARMSTVERFVAAEDNNATTSPRTHVESDLRTANAIGTEAQILEVAEAELPVPSPGTKMSKKERKKAEKNRRKEEEAYMGEDWWMGPTPAVPPVEPEMSTEQMNREGMSSVDAHDVEKSALDVQRKDLPEARPAESQDAQEPIESSTFDAALAATLDDAGFDPNLLANEQQHEQHERQATGSALDEDEGAARRRAESGERRRSRRSSAQSLHSVVREQETAVQDGGVKTIAASFEEVVASTLAMAGFDAGHFGGETQAKGRGEEDEEQEANEANGAETATGYMWKTGAKIMGLLGAGAVVGKTARDEAGAVADESVEREGVEAGIEEEEVGEVAIEDETHAENVAAESQDAATLEAAGSQSSDETASRSLPAHDNTISLTEQQEHDDSVSRHEQPESARTWSFGNIKPAHSPSHSPEDTSKPRLSTIPELEQAQKIDYENELLEQPFSAQATAARIFSNPRSPRTSFVASMRTPQGDAVQSLHVHRQRIPSGAGPETANIHRQAVRQEKRNTSPAASYLSPYHSPTASNVSIVNAPRSITPILRRTDRKLSGDLRALSRGSRDGEEVLSELKPKSVGGLTTSADVDKLYDPLRGSGSGRMSEVSISQQQQQQHEEWRDTRGSSPRAPPSLYRKQSRQILELESRIAQLSAENQTLQLQQASRSLSRSRADDHRDQSSPIQTKDVEISQLRAKLSVLREDTARLQEHNSQLQAANRNLSDDTNERYATLQAEHADVHEQLQRTEADLARLRETHAHTTASIEAAISSQISAALGDKDAEIAGLRAELNRRSNELEALQQEFLTLQSQPSSSNDDYLNPRSIDYFDSAHHQLFSHLSSWILRFSKFSDNRSCIPTSALLSSPSNSTSNSNSNEKLLARLDTALLDGSDVDVLLADRVRRRDVFMSLAVGMLWEYIFTRYLFGLERSQRQRLKTLERTLASVGPARAVAAWRATTLTLLSRLPSFGIQQALDAEAVVDEVLGSLSMLLPPPEGLRGQLRESLAKIVNLAVGLSVEMRCQRSEYVMLPPLCPEFDDRGELVRTVRFNAGLMQARGGGGGVGGERHGGSEMGGGSGAGGMRDEDDDEGGVVQLVLFPLVVKKGDEEGEGDEEIVVCPAQVVLARAEGPSIRELDRQHQYGHQYSDVPGQPPRKVVRVQSQSVLMDGRRAFVEAGPMSDISGIGGGGGGGGGGSAWDEGGSALSMGV